MKKLLVTIGLLLIVIGLVITRKDYLIEVYDTYISHKPKITTLDNKNEYYRENNYLFVQNTDDFSPKNKQELINVYYTIINSGVDTFTFKCNEEYTSCVKDVKDLANDQAQLSDINNYVHPFNGFAHIETEYDSLGRVTVNIVKSYTNEKIEMINKKVDELYPQLVNENDTTYNNIKRVHDYIINNTIYDSNRSDNGIINYESDIAYGPLFQGYAICGGYSDLMELFLIRMGVNCYKISSDDHVWNAVYYDGKWLHLDLTWDDPVSSDGRQYLEYNYFLIDTPKLLYLETSQHTFNQNHYLELKEA